MTTTDRSDSAWSRWTGAGFWNIYFLGIFALAQGGYLRLNLAYNAALLAFVLWPLETRWLRALRLVIALPAAFALAWHQSWLPGPDAVLANAANLADFSVDYLIELVTGAVSPVWAAAVFAAVAALLLLGRWVRLTAVTLAWFAFLLVKPWVMPYLSAPVPGVEVGAQPVRTAGAVNAAGALPAAPASADPVAQTEPATPDGIEAWYKRFVAYERDRKAEFPSERPADAAPFDLVILNICSLSDDDLEVSKLDAHPVLSRFDIRFANFSSATAYSGPATLRLLRGACGQPAHQALYDGRAASCETMNLLGGLGFSQSLYMDHNGKFDNYLSSLRERAGLTPVLSPLSRLRVRYEAFDGEPIYDSADLLNAWLSDREADAKAGNAQSGNAAFFNLVALHDGNRLPGTKKGLAFEPRAKALLDDLDQWMDKVEASGRRVMLVVVPEHGAAVRGDRIQMARLREIPSPRITRVPAAVKFFGVKTDARTVVKDEMSYLGLTSLIGRVIEGDVWKKGEVSTAELVKDLPTTHSVSENSGARVLFYHGKPWVSLRGEEWLPYEE